jgi:hypothetical protein
MSSENSDKKIEKDRSLGKFKKGKNKLLDKLIAPIILALLVGSSAPWWLTLFDGKDPNNTEVSYRVFTVLLHISSENQRPNAESLSDNLIEATFRVSEDIECIERTSTSSPPEVRFYHEEDREAAIKVQELARINGLSGIRLLDKTSNLSDTSAEGNILLYYPGSDDK